MTNIEDKAKYEEKHNMKLPMKINAFCDMCEHDNRIFEFAYIQQGHGHLPDIALYNCTGCNKKYGKITIKNTKAYQSLMEKFRGKIIE